MIFPALHRFAQSRGLLDDLDFTEQTLHAVIHLDATGAFTGLFPVGDKKAPVKKSVSRIGNRNSAPIPYLGADQANRIIPELDSSANNLVIKTQEAFANQLKLVHAETNHSGLQAVISFCERLRTDEAVRRELSTRFDALKLDVFSWVTFQVEGYAGYIVEWPEVMNWWRTKRPRPAPKKSKRLVPCIVTGKLCTPVETHGPRIKVAPQKKQQNVALISANQAAFGSYGFEKSLVSPMSEEAVEGYIRAINYLGDKAHSDHHYRTADTIFLFWCDRPEFTANPAKAIEEGQPDAADDWMFAAVRDAAPVVPLSDSAKTAVSVFKSADAGALTAGADAAKARFYCLALSGSSARGVIRGWIDQPLPDAVRHMREWFADLTIQLDRPLFDPTDKTKDPKKRRHLAEAGDIYCNWRLSETFGHSGVLWSRLCLVSSLQGKGEANPELARYRTQLFECAMHGRSQPVPLDLLSLACRRIATSGDCPPIRAALIQLFVRRFHHQSQTQPTTMSETDKTIQQSAAFACGRLLRVLEGVQKKALGDRNASVVDKFYSSASATPAAVLGHLVANAQPHLAKMRKDKTSAGLAHWFDEQITDIVEIIVKNGGYPSTNNPIGQGEFALGFYYQRILARKQKPDADDTLETEAAE